MDQIFARKISQKIAQNGKNAIESRPCAPGLGQVVGEPIRQVGELSGAQIDAGLVPGVLAQLELVVHGLCIAPLIVPHLDAQLVFFDLGQAVKGSSVLLLKIDSVLCALSCQPVQCLC